ncbi:MAG: DNA polymerase III subunit delta', partial [Deltaproteobacteria bacterium]|nr:DNA polymerase III subunit delta' [Deltaproteobacteria bacterium]
GHTKEIEMLKRAVAAHRVAHAYLFAGPAGTGKRRVAALFAAALNCFQSKGLFGGDAGEGNPCGSCLDCSMIEGNTHPNIMEIWPVDKNWKRADDGLIRIEQIRELQGSLNYKVERGRKVAIVEDADKLMGQAANAFLKTLEEPPPDSLIILISARPAELLPTILSRCQRINFRPLSEDLIKDFLIQEKGLNGEDASVISRLSAGSVSSAVRCASERVHETWNEAALRLKGLKAADTYGVLRFADEISKRDDLDDLLEFLKTRCRDHLVLHEGAKHLTVTQGLAPDRFNQGLEGPAGGNEARALALIESFAMIEDARRSIMPPRYANKQLTMEALLMRLAGNGAL